MKHVYGYMLIVQSKQNRHIKLHESHYEYVQCGGMYKNVHVLAVSIKIPEGRKFVANFRSTGIRI